MMRRNPQQLREAQIDRREQYLLETGRTDELIRERMERDLNEYRLLARLREKLRYRQVGVE